MDQIIARKIACYGRHGVLEKEKSRAQRFEIDLNIYKDLSTAAAKDDLQYSVDYSEIFEQVRDIVENKSFNLIETLASNIADMILTEYPVEKVEVSVYKPQAPIKGEFEYFAVKIERRRK
ncbi:MAG: dihydroneopterin aldolase [Syntrophomonadaceae bacterium]|jgi:dihydroneopterin aldolase|nr:dihydroneopterin aldolase [Syntrophomonadaceae bacterium]